MTWTILFSPSFVRVFPSQDEESRSTRPVYRAPDVPRIQTKQGTQLGETIAFTGVGREWARRMRL